MSGLPAKLTRDEAIVLVERIMSLEYVDDAELNSLLDQLERDLAYPDIAELIFSVPELTASEVVDRAAGLAAPAPAGSFPRGSGPGSDDRRGGHPSSSFR